MNLNNINITSKDLILSDVDMIIPQSGEELLYYVLDDESQYCIMS